MAEVSIVLALSGVVADTALLLNIISGRDLKDSTSAPVDVPDFTANLGQDIKGLRIGIPKEYLIDGMDPEVEAAIRAAIKQSG